MKPIVLSLLLFVSIQVRSQNSAIYTDTRDGQVYNTIQIGNLIWMSENLRYNLPGSFENPANTEIKYGRLYNWKQAQEVCPEGWQLPTDADWKSLERIFGMALNDLEKKYHRGKAIGTALKSVKYWIRGSGTNSSGFNALPAGYYAEYDKTFKEFGESAVFWSSSGINGIYKTYRYLLADSTTIYTNESKKEYAYSCRCVKKEMIENDSFFTDRRDGQVYKTVRIGNELWMAENLRYFETAGTEIPDDKTGEYGMLYNWTSLMAIEKKYSKAEWTAKENHRGICPLGWHIPSEEEWTSLLEELNNDTERMTSISGWEDAKNGNNSSGFNIYPSGYYAPSLGFNDFGTEAYFWTSENNSKEATNYIISNQRVGSSIVKKNYRYSCRCVKD
jgi:uncharacterized protein (TIGR02145 family)